MPHCNAMYMLLHAMSSLDATNFKPIRCLLHQLHRTQAGIAQKRVAGCGIQAHATIGFDLNFHTSEFILRTIRRIGVAFLNLALY